MKNKILFVCLGNICRSPAAESVFLHLIRGKDLQDKFYVDSAGTGGWHVGSKADARMRNAANKRDIDIQSISRQLSIQDFEDFDLILTMDNDNFETVSLLSKEAKSNARAIIKPILSYSTKSEILEIPDPYYDGDSGFEYVLDLLEDACDGLLNEIILSME